MKTFQTGRTYATPSICDSNCLVTVEVISRTPKTLQVKTKGKAKTLRIGTYDGEEFVKPWGSYSMCPIVRASDDRRL